MPRRKVDMVLIDNRRTRAVTFAKRKEGLLRKAQQLSVLCSVPVAVVCAGPDGGAPDVWASEAGILDSYRALPAEKRAEHTHLVYLNEQLGKENAKLARVRQHGALALAPPDSELDKMTLEGLRELLGSVDATLQATAERWIALGLPLEDDAVESGGHGVPCIGGNFAGYDGCPYEGYQYEMQAADNANILNQAMRDAFPPCYYNAGMMQPAHNAQYIGGNGYQRQMPANGNNDHGYGQWFLQQRNGMAQPGYIQCPESTYLDMSYGHPHPQWRAQFGHVDNGVPDLDMSGYGRPCDAIAPVEDPYMDMNGRQCLDARTAYEYQSQFAGDNFLDTPSGFLGVGIGGNVRNMDGYDTHSSLSGTNQNPCRIEELHYLSDVETRCLLSGTSQNPCGIEELHYLSDVADGLHFGADNRQLQLWEH